MDAFGIGAAMIGMARMYFVSARRSGRTTMLVESAKDGDRIVFSGVYGVERVRRMLKERGLAVECIILPPSEAHRLFERGTSVGRTIFDHEWLEEFYTGKLDDACKEVDYLQRQASGFGEAHYETRRQAEEIARWRI